MMKIIWQNMENSWNHVKRPKNVRFSWSYKT